MNATAAVCKMRSASTQSPGAWPAARAAPAIASPSVLGLVLMLGGCSAAPSAPPFADTARGARLAAQYQCGSCHTVPGVAGAQGKLAVTLESIGRRSYLAGRVPNRDPQLARWIADPASLVPNTSMPSMGVSDADARDIAAYLRTLR